MRCCVFLKKFTILVVLKVATVGCLNTILFTILPKANVVPGRTGVYSYSFSTRLRGPCYGTMVTNLCHCRESNPGISRVQDSAAMGAERANFFIIKLVI